MAIVYEKSYQGGKVIDRGITLIELLITLTILSILLAIGIPSFQQQVESNRTRAAADALLQAIQLTRTKAISNNRRATLHKLGSWQSGWEVFFDKDFDGVRDSDEDQIATSAPLTGVSITANDRLTNYVSFIGSGESRYAGTPNGGGFQAGTFTICPVNGGDGYQLILARSGRVRVESISAESC